MKYIGIDTGVNTGFAVWDNVARKLERVETMTITKAMELVKEYQEQGELVMYIEDARQRKWFGSSGREKLQGAGSVKRDATIWDGFCGENGLRCFMVAPVNNRTKLSAVQFRNLTGWQSRTNEHSRDAALLVYGR